MGLGFRLALSTRVSTQIRLISLISLHLLVSPYVSPCPRGVRKSRSLLDLAYISLYLYVCVSAVSTAPHDVKARRTWLGLVSCAGLAGTT